jgi:hypothetical protein
MPVEQLCPACGASASFAAQDPCTCSQCGGKSEVQQRPLRVLLSHALGTETTHPNVFDTRWETTYTRLSAEVKPTGSPLGRSKRNESLNCSSCRGVKSAMAVWEETFLLLAAGEIVADGRGPSNPLFSYALRKLTVRYGAIYTLLAVPLCATATLFTTDPFLQVQRLFAVGAWALIAAAIWVGASFMAKRQLANKRLLLNIRSLRRRHLWEIHLKRTFNLISMLGVKYPHKFGELGSQWILWGELRELYHLDAPEGVLEVTV